MRRALIALLTLAVPPTVWSGTGGEIPVAFYSPDITRIVSGSPIFPSDAHIENESGVTNPRPAGLPALLTNLRGVSLDALSRQAGRIVFSLDAAATINGTIVLPGDVARCENPSCSTLNLLLLAGVQLPHSVNVDAVSFDPVNGDLLYSIDADASYAGDLFLAADVVRWNGSSHTLEFDGRRLMPGVNLDALATVGTELSFSVDVATEIRASPTLTLLTMNQDVVSYNSNTQEFAFAGVAPSGDWSTANLDALHVETLSEADRLFADGFESL